MNSEELERLLKSNEVPVDVTPEQLLGGAKRARTRRRVVGGAIAVPAWQMGLRTPDPASPSAVPSAVSMRPTPTTDQSPEPSAPPTVVAEPETPPKVCQVSWPDAWQSAFSPSTRTATFQFASGKAAETGEGAFTWQGSRTLTFDNSHYFVDADDRYIVVEQNAGEVADIAAYELATGSRVHSATYAFATPSGALAGGHLLYVDADDRALESENDPSVSYDPATAVHEVVLVTLATGHRAVIATVPANAPYHVSLLKDGVLVNGRAYDFNGSPTTIDGQPDGATDRYGETWANATSVWRPDWDAPLTYPAGDEFTLRSGFLLTTSRADGSSHLLEFNSGVMAEVPGQRAWLTRDSLIIRLESGEFTQVKLDQLESKARC